MTRSGGNASRPVLDQLDDPRARLTLTVEGHELAVTNLDKPLWPGAARRPALTKRDLLRYLARVGPYLLPHLADRPLFVTRFPSGIGGQSFYQKHWPDPPPFARTVEIWSSQPGKDRAYLLCDNVATLLWLGQLAALELHPWFSRVTGGGDARGLGRRFTGSDEALGESVLNHPDFVVVDLDPYQYSGREKRGEEPELNRKAFARTRDVALHLRDLLGSLGLEAFVKTSGRTGLHLFLPILRRFDYDGARAVAETIGRHLERACPDEVTLEWAVKRRTGKIFFDYNQNSRGKSLASAFSPRRHALGTVSMPLDWDELERVYPTDFTLRSVPDLLDERGDPWAGILEAKQDLAAVLGRATAAARAPVPAGAARRRTAPRRRAAG